MAFFKIDPEKAKTQESRLNEYGAFVASQRSKIYKSSENNSHPVGTVEEAARAHGGTPGASGGNSGSAGPSSPDGSSTQPDSLGGDGSSSTLDGCASAIIGLATELNARRTEVVNLNSNGIDNKNPDGTYSYYLPDPPEGTTDTAAYWASMDTASNVRTYNTQAAASAKKQAQELQTAVNSGDAEKAEKLRAEIEKHQDVPAYGASFVKSVGGARAYLNLVNNANQTFARDPNKIQRMTDTLGHLLGGASQPSVGGEQLGKEFGAEIYASKSPNDAAAFNALVTTTGTKFGSDFILNAADVLEEVDPKTISSGSTYLSTEYSTDPLAGVMELMAKDKDLSLAYLSGKGSVDKDGNWNPDKDTQHRWEKLTSRDWDAIPVPKFSKRKGARPIENFSAALAQASSFRNPDADHPNAENDARATYAAAKGMKYFASDKWPKEKFSEAMQKNVATVVANSPEELAAASSGSSYSGSGDGPGLNKWGVDAKDISTLVYRFGNNSDAMATVSVAAGKYHGERIEAAASAAKNGSGEEDFKNKYQQSAATTAYLEQLSNMRFDDDIKKNKADAAKIEEQRNKTVGTSMAVANTAIGLMISAASAGTGAPAAYPIASNITQPMTTDFILKQLGSPEVDTTNSAENSYNRRKAQGYAIVLNHEMASGEGVKPSPEHNKTVWYREDANGRPSIDANSLSNEQVAEMLEWKNDGVAGDNNLRPLNGVESSVADGQVDAEHQVAGGKAAAAPRTN